MGDIQADGSVPGYFVGRPATYAEQPKAADQPTNTQSTPGDYFVGRPENLQQQQQQQEAQGTGTAPPPADQRRPGVFAKLFSCVGGGGATS